MGCKTSSQFLHLFELQNVIEEYESCVAQHNPVLDANDEETEILATVRFRQYDVFELFDRALSRLLVESFLSASFREVMKTRFYHYENFEELSGQIYFMRILDACSTSTAINIEGAEKSFNALTLFDFPGENMSDLATIALKKIKIMSGAKSCLEPTHSLPSSVHY